MSTLSQFGAGIKSIQRGTVSIANTASQNTATLATAVNTSKASINYLGTSTTASAATDYMATLFLTNSTTVTVTRNGSSGGVTVSYEVVEFY